MVTLLCDLLLFPSLTPQGSLVFVVGKNEGLLTVSGRRHNADDLVATALAVERVKTGECHSHSAVL